ncbi:MAG: 16S rRNA (adenine(1518)-N(6)/adenine(1519)-N(6))-dimethyltransferase RsmA [Firmicutes bacterium]|nr:16S rRNA (adenine(1518)-N(6)/adenine(1519)-N(6))-dimethyltransferase RsmA [Bacillota bacterium]
MDWADPRTISGLQQVLAKVGGRPNKRLGQNFLIDPKEFEEIARAIKETNPVWVLEIGAGPGGLTGSLLERGLEVVAIEIDSTWSRWLSSSLLTHYPQSLEIVEADALNVSWQEMANDKGGPWTICGNLPYSMTSPILFRLLEDTRSWSAAVFMVQKEVAERLLAEPGNRDTSALSVLLRYAADVKGLKAVSRHAFYPSPKVDSFVIQLTRIPSPAVPFEAFKWSVHAAFSHRRKMIRQSLSKAPGSMWSAGKWEQILIEGGLDPLKRAEALSWADWIRLATIVATKMR